MGIFLNKVPRARLYVRTHSLIRALLQLPFTTIHRSQDTLRFEQSLQKFFDSPHAQTFSSCRMALFFILKNLGLQPGDEVLLTPITIPDIVNAIHTLGFKPVFVDLSLEAQNIDIADLQNKITSKSKVLLLTHLSGLVPEMNKILEIATNNDLKVIEDISQCQGATYNNQKLGSFGIAAVASMSISKTIGSLWGGFMLTSDSTLFEKVQKDAERSLVPPSKRFLLKQIFDNLKVNIATERIVFSFFTYYAMWLFSKIKNQSMNNLHEDQIKTKFFFENPNILRKKMPQDAFTFFCDLQSQIALDCMKHLHANNQRRIHLAETLKSHLNESSKKHLPPSPQTSHQNTFWHFPMVITKHRQNFEKFLLSKNIDTTGYGLKVCSALPAFQFYASKNTTAERIKKETVFIPIHSSFTEYQMKYMANVVNQFFQRIDAS